MVHRRTFIEKTNDISWMLWIVFFIAYSLSPANGFWHSDGAKDNIAVDCPSNMFACGDGICILEYQRCNIEVDCNNGNDENDCKQADGGPECTTDTFACSDAPKTCIDKLLVCDGHTDCRNGADEDKQHCNNWNCPGYKCPAYNGTAPTCISEDWVCDDTKDCPGGDDENQCKGRLCKQHMWTCGDGTCIDKHWKCNGEPDCPDGSDEGKPLCGDVTCPEEHFQCRSGACVVQRWFCDGDEDCGDGSDEENCPHVPEEQRCSSQELYCRANSECIQGSWVCDGQSDCTDGQDEKDCWCCLCNRLTFTYRCSTALSLYTHK